MGRGSKPCICEETGEYFQSATDAAKQYEITSVAVSISMKYGYAAAKHHFRFLTETDLTDMDIITEDDLESVRLGKLYQSDELREAYRNSIRKSQQESYRAKHRKMS